jgi:hypothetical protein
MSEDKLAILLETIDEASRALSRHKEKFERIQGTVESWVKLANNQSVPEPARVTYLQCARAIAEIMIND